jgi:predicted  nucleic acid-binding Zn-ribbon protein
MLADLEHLIALQRLESAAQDAQRRMAEEPERMRAFDARVEVIRVKVAAAKDHLADNQNARRAIEKDVAMHQSRLSKFRDQLMSVKTNVEYQAVQKEIEFAQTEVKALEDRVLERMLEADDLTAGAKRVELELAAEQKAVDAERRALSAELAALKQSVEGVNQQRAAVAAAIDPKVLDLFELVSKRRNGVAVAEAREGICTICHVRLRPQVFNTVRRNEEIVQCDHCNRILYFIPVATAAADTTTQPAP